MPTGAGIAPSGGEPRQQLRLRPTAKRRREEPQQDAIAAMGEGYWDYIHEWIYGESWLVFQVEPGLADRWESP
jgi:hypothetical protein